MAAAPKFQKTPMMTALRKAGWASRRIGKTGFALFVSSWANTAKAMTPMTIGMYTCGEVKPSDALLMP